VAGLPDPRPDHAVAMVRFARDCHLKMGSMSSELEVALGPDTADLAFRIGIHSGPVTGGVLRGQNSRFQLFGKACDQLRSVSKLLVQIRIPNLHVCLRR
jgi:adenylate cyclase